MSFDCYEIKKKRIESQLFHSISQVPDIVLGPYSRGRTKSKYILFASYTIKFFFREYIQCVSRECYMSFSKNSKIIIRELTVIIKKILIFFAFI